MSAPRLVTTASATPARLVAAAALCLAPMGLTWSTTPGISTPGSTIYGFCDGDGFCTPDTYIPGYYTPGQVHLVSQSPVRIFLLLAALVFAYAATRARTAATLRAVRAATGAVALTAVLAAANSVPIVLLVTLGALALVGPLALRRPVRPAALSGDFGARAIPG